MRLPLATVLLGATAAPVAVLGANMVPGAYGFDAVLDGGATGTGDDRDTETDHNP